LDYRYAILAFWISSFGSILHVQNEMPQVCHYCQC